MKDSDGFDIIDPENEKKPKNINELDEFDVLDAEEKEEPKKTTVWMPNLDAPLWQKLLYYQTVYNSYHAVMLIPQENVESSKKLCLDAIEERIEVIEAEGKLDELEYGECLFLKNALNNGWLVSDISILTRLYEEVYRLKDEKDKGKGVDLLDYISKEKCDTMDRRYNLVDISKEICMSFGSYHNEFEDLYHSFLGMLKNSVQYTELPDDQSFVLPKEKKTDMPDRVPDTGQQTGQGGVLPEEKRQSMSLMDLQKNKEYLGKRRKARKEGIKFKTDYQMEVLEEKDLEKFTLHDGHRHNKIKKSNRQALKEVFGEEIYDDIDEMHRGSSKERVVKLYHSYGTQLLKEGKGVMEIEFAGSSFQDVAHIHKGRDGHVIQNPNGETYMEEQYGGKKVQKDSTTSFKYLREHISEVTVGQHGEKAEKKKYSIAGPSPDLWFYPGLFNLGEYSIENTKTYGRDFAEKFLRPYFESWANGEPIRELHIGFSGHSRGAVAEGQCIKLIDEWIQKNAKDHPEYREHVHYDGVFNESVPGFLTNLHLSSCNLKNIPNVNATVICSMAQEHVDFFYPLQYIKGAKRLIIGTTEHADLWGIDTSQRHLMDDKEQHQMGFYDAETGEMYRGSGINQMPDGVYISDEKRNLIRLTSYSQLGKVMDTVYNGKSKQRIRTKNIHRMARDWFVENNLQMSFADDASREEEMLKYQNVAKKILASENSRIQPVKHALENIMDMEGKEMVDPAQQEEMRNQLISICKAYMKKTSIPAKGDSAYRMNLVSDVLSFAMREKNYQTKGFNSELDQKIRMHKAKLENKKGGLERKIQKEEKRLERVKGIAENIKEISGFCKKGIGSMDKARTGRWTGYEYDGLYDILKKGAALGEQTSITEFGEFLKKMTKAANQYIRYHDSLFGPQTKEESFRLNFSKKVSGMGKEYGENLFKTSVYISDRDLPVAQKIKMQKKSIEGLQEKAEKIKAEEERKKENIKENAKKKVQARAQMKAQAGIKNVPGTQKGIVV